MQCEKISMEEVESHITQALYQVVSEQTRASDTNIRIRQKVGEEEEKEIEALKKNILPKGLSDAIPVISAICTAVTIVAGFAIAGAFFLPPGVSAAAIIVFGLIGGGAMVIQGIFQVISGSYQKRAANNNGIIKQKTALEGYVETRNDNINTKTKNAYKALSSLTKAFNKLIATFGDTVMKVIK